MRDLGNNKATKREEGILEASRMKRKQMIEALESGDYDAFGDDLHEELLMFPQEYPSVKKMIEDQGSFNMARFLAEDFPDRYEW